MRYKGYDIIAQINIIMSLVFTKLLYKKARLIRLPCQIRCLGSFEIGRNFTTGRYCRIDIFKTGRLVVENDVEINDSVHIACAGQIIIKKNVLIASRVYITDHDHVINSSDRNLLEIRNTIIEENVWIGEGVSILKGVTIGHNSVIGANTVVTKSMPPFSIVVGCSGKSIKTISNIS